VGILRDFIDFGDKNGYSKVDKLVLPATEL